MRRNSLLIITCWLLSCTCFAQSAKPKLVVGLVIDQMRWDFLYRYSSLYSGNGFKRLLKEGFSAENTLIPYVPTYTAPGHTAIYTGSPPAISGIPGNDWFDKSTGKDVYCTSDEQVEPVGGSNAKAGKMSPANLWVTTVTDELRLSNNFKSKVIGIALKDRGAILPAGHTANAAYWYDNGAWITSSHYMKTLPEWVNQFNGKDVAGTAMRTDWHTLLPLEQYDLSSADDQPYENTIKGETTVVFPHKLSSIAANDKYEAFRTTPFANSFTFAFAKAAIENEALGQHSVPDFLTISMSSTDYIGHTFGPNSVEIEDTYLRLDKDIADFLSYLDTKIGKGTYTLFLTADHGVAHVPRFLSEHKILGAIDQQNTLPDFAKELNEKIAKKFAITDAVSKVMNYQVYLDAENIAQNSGDINAIKQFLLTVLMARDDISHAVELDKVQQAALPAPLKEMMINGYNPKRSGDIQVVYKPGYLANNGQKGTSHGLWNP
ncbi:MAG: alkaline phosphatase PafA, partial [Methylococcales bacterium]